MNNERITIAIDGYSSCGKSTVAKDLAAKLNYAYIDTGAMYRCVTLFALRQGFIVDGWIDEAALAKALDGVNIRFLFDAATKQNVTFLNDERVEEEIRGMEVSGHVSAVSALAFVRERLVALQQEMGKAKGVVLDGRDIGTVVFPDAELKIFMTTDPKVRAQRRYDELKAKGNEVPFGEVLQNIEQRDLLDTTRKESPLRQAEDAIVLDNGTMGKDEQLDWIVARM